MQMALLAPVHFVPMQLSQYRQHDSNRSASSLYESMDELHRMWWNDTDLTEAKPLRFATRLSSTSACPPVLLYARLSIPFVRTSTVLGVRCLLER